jgi:ribose transport system permease protein
MKRPRIRLGLDRFSGIYLWILFIVVFSIWSPHIFPTASTAYLLASTQAVAGIVALAVLIPMICGQFDLSVGANANLTGLIAVLVQVQLGWSLWEALPFAIGIGLLVGFVNGFIVVRFKVSSFIVTLGMGSILTAFAEMITGSITPPSVTSAAWNNMTQFKFLGFQIIIYYLLIFAVIAWWVLEHTPAGRYMRAIGGNLEASRLSGIPVDRWAWISLVAAGGISGAGGVLYTSLTGPSLTFGSTLLLPAFAAVFLGATQLKPGRFNVWGTLLAIFVLATGAEGLQLVSGVQWISDMFNGVALVVAVTLAATRLRQASRKQWRRRTGATRSLFKRAPESNASQAEPTIDEHDFTAPLHGTNRRSST